MRLAVILCLCLSVFSCSHSAPDNRAVYVLFDRSGTYAQQFDKVVATTKLLLAGMEPGDSLALARVDNENFSEQNMVAAVTFSSRPSQSNNQKRVVLKIVEQLAGEIRVGSYTDVTGGLLHAMSWLNATGAGKKIILVFSDFPDEPREGYMREFPVNFNGAHVVVWDVPQAEPPPAAVLTETKSFAERANAWQQRVEAGDGHWHLVNAESAIMEWLQ